MYKLVKDSNIELAKDFVIIQPEHKTRLWLILLIMIVVFLIIVSTYYNLTRPFIYIFTEKKSLVSSSVLMGVPAFLDNDTLIYLKSTSHGQIQLLLRRLQSDEEVIMKTFKDTRCSQPALSGRTPDDQIFSITLIEQDVQKVVVIQLNNLVKVEVLGEWATVSHDNKKLAFCRRSDDRMEIWTMNVDGSEQKFMNIWGSHPEFSPSRYELIFESEKVDGKTSIQLFDVTDPTSMPKVLATCGVSFPTFFPDGKAILFSKKGDGLWAMKRNGSKKVKLISASSPSEMIIGRISPNGKKLAVWSGEGTKGNLWIYEVKYRPSIMIEKKIDIDRLTLVVNELEGDEGIKVAEEHDERDTEASNVYEPTGYLHLKNVKPESGVHIYIDDEEVAVTPIDGYVPVMVGKHAIRLENPDAGVSWEAYYEFKPEEVYTISDIDLR